MAVHVKIDTDQMLAVAQKGSVIADNIVGHAQTLRNGIDFVLNSWQGQSGDAYRASMQAQKTMLDQLIRKLQAASELMKQGGHGFDSQDSSGSAKAQTQGQQFLNGTLNA